VLLCAHFTLFIAINHNQSNELSTAVMMVMSDEVMVMVSWSLMVMSDE
jgi:hypothetical protein